MLRGRDFEIFDEPGLEVPHGLRVAAGVEDEVAGPPLSLNRSASAAPGGTDRGGFDIHAGARVAGPFWRCLSGVSSARVVAVAALVVAAGVTVALLQGRNEAGGSSNGPRREHPGARALDAGGRHRAALPRRPGRRLGRRMRRPDPFSGNARGESDAATTVAPSSPQTSEVLPDVPPRVTAPELPVAPAHDSPLPAPATPRSPFEP
jgi:hypothetical protein